MAADCFRWESSFCRLCRAVKLRWQSLWQPLHLPFAISPSALPLTALAFHGVWDVCQPPTSVWHLRCLGLAWSRRVSGARWEPPCQQLLTVLGTGTKDTADWWVFSFQEEPVFKSLNSLGCLEIQMKSSFELYPSVTLVPLERKKNLSKKQMKRESNFKWEVLL